MTYPAYGPSNWAKALIPYTPCMDGYVWAARNETYAGAWASCDRGDWMLWLMGVLAGASGSAARQVLVLAASDCLQLTPAAMFSTAGQTAVTVATAWANGTTALVNVQAQLPVLTPKVRAASRLYESADANADFGACALCQAAYADDASIANYCAFVSSCLVGGGSAVSRKVIMAQCANLVRVRQPVAPVLPGSGIPPPLQHISTPNYLLPVDGRGW